MDTPNLIFCAYAFGCAGTRLEEGSLRQTEYDALKQHLCEGTEPPDELMERCFPRACQEIGKPRTVENVRAYWRLRHNESRDPTPVVEGTIGYVTPTGEEEAVLVQYHRGATYKTLTAFNYRHLFLEKGDRVLVHGCSLAEVIRDE